ncbi:MAG: hypothetical protein ACREV8_15505 [Gammaproteobacteria bacterium]
MVAALRQILAPSLSRALGKGNLMSKTELSQVAVMAGVVATLVYFPLGIALALILPLLGIATFDALLTFGGAMHFVLGLLLWWLLTFAGACGYAAWMFPWGEKAG